ncbi:hypothetical protein ACN24K_10360 [Streptomyces microflavus]
MSPLTYTDAVGEALERLRGVGFEHGPRFVNHAPMAAEALAYMGYADDVPRWVDRNLRTHTYHEVPDARWAIDPADPDDWRSALGDFSRVADWTALFERELAQAPWPEVLARWWPRLLPGMSGVLTHGVIRTAHAVRAISRAGEKTWRTAGSWRRGSATGPRGTRAIRTASGRATSTRARATASRVRVRPTPTVRPPRSTGWWPSTPVSTPPHPSATPCR